jgi:DNA-binding response OmpR family regulator
MIKVLIVDDEVEVVEFLTNFLKRRVSHVSTATNAKEALEIFARERPELVLLDVRMPGEDGFVVLEKMKEVNKDIKVIMVTARDDKASIAKAKKMGADNYLTKPLELENLDSILSEYIKKDNPEK